MGSTSNKRYSCDFETNNYEDDCRIWAWGSCEIWKENSFEYGRDMDDFIDWLFQKERRGSICYFHNAKFDISFIIPHLFNNGFRHVASINNLESGLYFTELRTEMGQVYSLTIYNGKDKRGWRKVTIQDSLKIINSSVESMAKGFGLDIMKGTIDYMKERPIGYNMDDIEIDYLKNDVEIVAQSLNKLFEMGYLKMTMSSNALWEYKTLIGKREFERRFPVLKFEVDDFIRSSYKGGVSYVNPLCAKSEIGKGVVLDVVSLYPSRMKLEILPYGLPLKFNGEYKNDKIYFLYVQRLLCHFEIKDNHLPTIQLKNYPNEIPSTEYLMDDKGEPRILTLTNVDLDLFFEHYNVEVVEWLGGYKFKGKKGMFDEYIDKWFEVKDNAKIEGNKALYSIAKYFLNTLYGKFGTNPIRKSKTPYIGDDGIIYYKLGKEEITDSVYVAIATFITSYGRALLLREAQKVKHRFLYTDTDSLHLSGQELPTELHVDGNVLGAWDDELYFERGKFICAKRYLEQYYYFRSGRYKVTKRQIKHSIIIEPIRQIKKPLKSKIACSGLPSKIHSKVTWDNFNIGTIYLGKLSQKVVKGGTILQETTFQLNDKLFSRF